MWHIPSTWLSSLLTPCGRSLVAGAALINLILPCIVCFLFLFPSECLSCHILTDLPGEVNAFYLAYLLWSHPCHQTLLQSLMVFIETLGNICPSPPATKHLLAETSRAQTRVRRGAGDAGHIHRDLGLGLRPDGLWLAKGAVKPGFLASFLFPHCNFFKKVPALPSGTRSPPIRSDKGQDLKQSLSHCQTSHLS